MGAMSSFRTLARGRHESRFACDMGATQYYSANQSRRVEWLCLGTNRGCEGVDSHIQFLLVRAANSSVVGNPEARNSARNAARSPTSSDSSTPVCKLESKLLRMIVGRRRELKAKLRASSFSCDPRIFFGRASFCLYD